MEMMKTMKTMKVQRMISLVFLGLFFFSAFTQPTLTFPRNGGDSRNGGNSYKMGRMEGGSVRTQATDAKYGVFDLQYGSLSGQRQDFLEKYDGKYAEGKPYKALDVDTMRYVYLHYFTVEETTQMLLKTTRGANLTVNGGNITRIDGSKWYNISFSAGDQVKIARWGKATDCASTGLLH